LPENVGLSSGVRPYIAPLRHFPSRRASRRHDPGSRARWQSGHRGSQSTSWRMMASRMVAKESA
jgi:hypothetical protein